MIALLVIFGVLGIGFVLVIYGTIARNRWGINLDPLSCPRCKTRFPTVRNPENLREMMWGGATCQACGTAVDKWGRELLSSQ